MKQHALSLFLLSLQFACPSGSAPSPSSSSSSTAELLVILYASTIVHLLRLSRSRPRVSLRMYYLYFIEG